MLRYLKTAQMACLEKTSNGILWLLPDILIKMCTLVVFLALWRQVMLSGAQVDLSMPQMLSYTYVSALLTDLLVVKTPATGWLSEGVLMRLYGRPQRVLGQLVAITAGGWTPMLLLFSLPMALAAPLLGVSLAPVSFWFWPSFALCISLGFAIDVLFACLSIKLRNMSWLIGRVREAIVLVLSGTVIPIQLLPLGLADMMKYQPFASLGGAPLSLLVGMASPGEVLGLQLAWNGALWLCALIAFRKSQEGMVSYGG